MRVELALRSLPAAEAGDYALLAESAGFDGVTVNETARDSIVAATVAAVRTSKIDIATSVTLAFPRSPMVTAMAAWDVQQLASGRFSLGLGTQVRAHIVRRFGVEWSAPAERLADYVDALRAIWSSFESGDPLRHEGKFYRLSLLTREFNPGSQGLPPIPVELGGVGRLMCRLAGRTADRYRGHLIITPKYLEEFVVPAIREGARQSGDAGRRIPIVATSFQAVADTGAGLRAETERVRRQIAFYLSTPSYKPVLECHGLSELGERLSRMASAGQWDAMPGEISDDVLRTFAIVGLSEELGSLVNDRWSALVEGYAIGAIPESLIRDTSRMQRVVDEIRGS